MPGVLTTSSTVGCGHDPGAVGVSSQAKLTVSGSPVLLADSINGKSVAVCGIVPASDSSGPTDVPCKTVTSVDAGQATKLTTGGQPVILDTLAGKTDGMATKVTPQTRLKGSAGQTKLTAV